MPGPPVRIMVSSIAGVGGDLSTEREDVFRASGQLLSHHGSTVEAVTQRIDRYTASQTYTHTVAAYGSSTGSFFNPWIILKILYAFTFPKSKHECALSEYSLEHCGWLLRHYKAVYTVGFSGEGSQMLFYV